MLLLHVIPATPREGAIIANTRSVTLPELGEVLKQAGGRRLGELGICTTKRKQRDYSERILLETHI